MGLAFYLGICPGSGFKAEYSQGSYAGKEAPLDCGSLLVPWPYAYGFQLVRGGKAAG